MELTRELGNFIVQTDYDNLPAEIQQAAKERLLDTIGAMIAGRAGWAYGDALIAAMKNLGSGTCSVIGPDHGSCFPAARAAMINAAFAHAIELDDGHKFAGVHAGAVIIPTALAIGQDVGATGKEILAAIVIGYEIVYRLAVAQSPDLIERGFHPSATCGTVGAMAVAGKLLGLNEQQMANGLGMSVLQASGMMEATVSGQQSKCVMVGNSAFNGIACAYVAQAGLEGCLTAFEGKTGLFHGMSRCIAPEEVTAGLGRDYWIVDTYNKFYPTCRHAQPAIEAVLDLAVEYDIDPAQVERILVGTHHVAYELTGLIYEPKNPGEAKFSIPYGVAAALVDHGVAVRHLEKQAFQNKKYLDLAQKVQVFIDEKINGLYPKKRGAQIQITLKDGTIYSRECFDLKGSPQNPVNFDALKNKFVISATNLLSNESIAKIQQLCTEFERGKEVSQLLSLLNW